MHTSTLAVFIRRLAKVLTGRTSAKPHILLLFLCSVSFATPAASQIVFFMATAPELARPAVGNYGPIRSVAVLSAIGSQVTLINSYFFSTKTKKLDAAEWQIDGLVEKAIKTYLGDRFEYHDIPFNHRSLETIPNGPLTNSLGKVRIALQGVQKDDIDAFIVVRPGWEIDDQKAGGLVLANGDTPPIVWANYEIDIFDAKTLETVGHATSRIQLREGNMPSFPNLLGSRNLKLSDELQPSEKQIAELRAMTERVVKVSILETLRALKIDAAPLPPVGARVLAPMAPDEAPYKQLRTLAVVSGIGDAFEFKSDGFFGTQSASVPIPDWSMDAQVEAAVRASLSKRFVVKDTTVDRMAFAESQLVDKDRKFAPKLVGLKPSDDFDAYLLVMKIPVQFEMATPQLLGTGVGLHSLTRPAITRHPAVYASYAVALVDAKTLKVQLVSASVPSPKYPKNFPYAEVDDSLWPKKPPMVTDMQLQALQQATTTVLNDSINETLLEMGLTDTKITSELPTLETAAARQ